MKIVCVYHSLDLDGWMSAAIVKHWFESNKNKTNNDPLKSCNVYKEQGCSHVDGMLCNTKECDILHGTLDFIGYNYGNPISDLSEYDKVIMCDISFPKNIMLSLFDRLDKNFIWIDHHISAIKDIIGDLYNYLDDVDESTLLNGSRNRTYAACELTWDFFFPDDDVPSIVRLLGMYDSFRHKGTDEEQKVLEFQYGARQVISNYEEAYIELYTCISTKGYSMQMIQKNGKSIYQYLCTEAKQSYKNGFEITFDEDKEYRTGKTFKFICINKERFNPINFGIDYHKEGYDGAACFHYDGVSKLWKFSLYNDNGLVDCSIIAKQFGGGGHKGAAGFVLKDLSVLFKD